MARLGLVRRAHAANNEDLITQPLKGKQMTDHDALLKTVDQLAGELQRMEMAQTVQRSAWLLLARHLGARPAALAQDLETMCRAHPDAGWRSGHESLADALRLVHDASSGRRTESGPRHA